MDVTSWTIPSVTVCAREDGHLSRGSLLVSLFKQPLFDFAVLSKRKCTIFCMIFFGLTCFSGDLSLTAQTSQQQALCFVKVGQHTLDNPVHLLCSRIRPNCISVGPSMSHEARERDAENNLFFLLFSFHYLPYPEVRFYIHFSLLLSLRRALCVPSLCYLCYVSFSSQIENYFFEQTTHPSLSSLHLANPLLLVSLRFLATPKHLHRTETQNHGNMCGEL